MVKKPVPKKPDIKTAIMDFAAYLLKKENDGPGAWTNKEASAYLSSCRRELNEIQADLDLYTRTRKNWNWLHNRHFQKHLGQMLRQTRFHDVLCYLSSMATWGQTQAVAELLPKEERWVLAVGKGPKGRDTWRGLILVRLNVEHAAETLGMSEESVRKYLKKFVEFGIIKAHGRAGGRNLAKIYSLGVWQQFPNLRRLFYLKSTPEWRQKISGFTLRGANRGR